ncbi:hypothetical protein HK096_009212 [Nowakowskiella sp. JEL0078]|nr:hypothetical protein HK096_009212 [Nowakowskiella sp. JEL0078]
MELTLEDNESLLAVINHVQHQNQPIQITNSQFKQISNSIDLSNSDHLPFQIYPSDPRNFHSRDEFPYPPEIMNDMVISFFSRVSFWPLNFLHGPSILTNPFQIPRALLSILCARGCKFSKYISYLSLQENVEEVLFKYAKKSCDFEELSMNGLVTNFHLALFCCFSGRYRSAWVYISIFLTSARLLKLYIDPDEIEQNNGVKFSLVEKELRRRTWFALRIIGNGHRSLLRDFPEDKVRLPMTTDLFESLVDTQEVLMPLPMIRESRNFNIEPIAYELILWKERISKFHTEVCLQSIESFDILDKLLKAAKLQTGLQQWFSNQPEWFKTVFESDKIYVKLILPKDPNQIPWLAANLQLLYHALSIFIYRFILIFVSGSGVLEPLQAELSKDFISTALGICWNSQKCLQSGLKNCILRLDPNFENVYPVVLYVLCHSVLFTSTMSQFAETVELREIARNDFEFTISFLKTVSLVSQFELANTVVADMKFFDKTPPSILKYKMICFLWKSGVDSFEEHLEVLGNYGFYGAAMGTPSSSIASSISLPGDTSELSESSSGQLEFDIDPVFLSQDFPEVQI